MRNKFTRLSVSAMVFAFALSSGAVYARNILPDAMGNTSWPNQGGNASNRASPIDDDRSYGPGNYMRDYDRATRLMNRALGAKSRGDFVTACRFANSALETVAYSYSLRGSAMESDYAAFANEVCEAARKV